MNVATKDHQLAQTNVLKAYHLQTILAREKQRVFHFYARVPKMRNGRRMIGVFANDLETNVNGNIEGRNVYVELVDLANYEPLDAKRTLYLLPYNKFFRQEFEVDEKYPTMYHVPLDEMAIIWSTEQLPVVAASEFRSPAKSVDTFQSRQFTPTLETDDNYVDEMFSKMTIRDYLAINWKKPISGKKWLNEIIVSQS